jgi:ketosteroid isomerase-like protein
VTGRRSTTSLQRTASGRDVPSGRTIRGVKELVDGCRTFTTAFPDFSVESVTLIGQGDLVANEWSARGRHDGPPPRTDGGNYEPTGRSFARTGVGIVEVRDGKIVRYRDYFDRQAMTEQLGLD